MNYLVEGNDPYLVKEKINSLVRENVGQPDEWNVRYCALTETTMPELVADANQIPFFSERKAIVINDANLNLQEGKKGGITKDDLDLLVKYLQDPSPTTTLIFDISGYGLLTRSEYGKKINKLCQVIRINPLDADTFAALVRTDLKKNGIKLDPKAEKALLERLPVDVGNWRNELWKLTNYPGKIDEQIVRQLVPVQLFGSGEKDTLLFVNAILSRDLKKTMVWWHDLSQQTKEYYSLIGLIASQLRFLYQVKYLKNQGYMSDEIAKQLGANPYRVKKNLEMVGQYQLSDISDLLNQLSELDVSIKTGEIDDRLGFELFLLKAAGGNRLWNH